MYEYVYCVYGGGEGNLVWGYVWLCEHVCVSAFVCVEGTCQRQQHVLLAGLERPFLSPCLFVCVCVLAWYLAVCAGGWGLQTKYSKNIPMSEIDFSNCEHMGTSYRSLPSDYPIPLCSGRTELCEVRS